MLFFFACQLGLVCLGWDVDTSLFLRTVASLETLNGQNRWEPGLEHCLCVLEVLTIAGLDGWGVSLILRWLIVVHCFQMLHVLLRSLCCFRNCMHHVRHRVATQCIMSLLPFYKHTQKKRKFTCYERLDVVQDKRFITYGIRTGSTCDLGSLQLSLI